MRWKKHALSFCGAALTLLAIMSGLMIVAACFVVMSGADIGFSLANRPMESTAERILWFLAASGTFASSLLGLRAVHRAERQEPP